MELITFFILTDTLSSFVGSRFITLRDKRSWLFFDGFFRYRDEGFSFVKDNFRRNKNYNRFRKKNFFGFRNRFFPRRNNRFWKGFRKGYRKKRRVPLFFSQARALSIRQKGLLMRKKFLRCLLFRYFSKTLWFRFVRLGRSSFFLNQKIFSLFFRLELPMKELSSNFFSFSFKKVFYRTYPFFSVVDFRVPFWRKKLSWSRRLIYTLFSPRALADFNFSKGLLKRPEKKGNRFLIKGQFFFKRKKKLWGYRRKFRIRRRKHRRRRHLRGRRFAFFPKFTRRRLRRFFKVFTYPFFQRRYPFISYFLAKVRLRFFWRFEKIIFRRFVWKFKKKIFVWFRRFKKFRGLPYKSTSRAPVKGKFPFFKLSLFRRLWFRRSFLFRRQKFRRYRLFSFINNAYLPLFRFVLNKSLVKKKKLSSSFKGSFKEKEKIKIFSFYYKKRKFLFRRFIRRKVSFRVLNKVCNNKFFFFSQKWRKEFLNFFSRYLNSRNQKRFFFGFLDLMEKMRNFSWEKVLSSPSIVKLEGKEIKRKELTRMYFSLRIWFVRLLGFFKRVRKVSRLHFSFKSYFRRRYFYAFRFPLVFLRLIRKSGKRKNYLLHRRPLVFRKGFKFFLSWAYLPLWLKDTSKRFELNSSLVFIIHRIFTYFFRLFRMRLASLFSDKNGQRSFLLSYFFLRPSQVNAEIFVRFFIRRLLKHYMPPQIFFRFYNFMYRRFKVPASCSGFMLKAKGRFGKRQMASFFRFQRGKMRPSTVSAGVDYAFSSIPLKFGACGIKVFFAWSKPDVQKRYFFRRFNFGFPKVFKFTEGRPGFGGFVINLRYLRRFRKSYFYASSFLKKKFLRKVSNRFLRQLVLYRPVYKKIVKDVGMFVRSHSIFERLFERKRKFRFLLSRFIRLKRWAKVFFKVLPWFSAFLRLFKKKKFLRFLYRNRKKHLRLKFLERIFERLIPSSFFGKIKTKKNSWRRFMRARLFRVLLDLIKVLFKLSLKRRRYVRLFRRYVRNRRMFFYVKLSRLFRKRMRFRKGEEYNQLWRSIRRKKGKKLRAFAFFPLFLSYRRIRASFKNKNFCGHNRFLYFLTMMRRYQFFVFDRVRMYRELEKRKLLSLDKPFKKKYI